MDIASSPSIPRSRRSNGNSIVSSSRPTENPVTENPGENRTITDGKRTLLRTILNAETFHGEQPKTVIRFVQLQGVLENGVAKFNVRNSVKIVRPLEHQNSSRLQSRTDSPPEVPDVSTDKSETKTTRKANVHGKKYLYICIFVALISILLTFLAISLATEPIKMKELQYDLSNNVLTQHSAVKTFLDSIELLRQPSPKKVITGLIGSSGVGKTYLINILQKHVDSRTIHIFQPHDLSSLNPVHMRYKMILCDYNILVFDNFRNTDLEKLEHFIEQIMESKRSNILIIAIFNIQDVDSHMNFSMNYEHSSAIKQKLERLSEYFYICEFNELNVTTVEDWIRDKLATNNIDQRHHSNIIAELLKIQDVKNYGLKGIHGKLLLELSKYRFEPKFS